MEESPPVEILAHQESHCRITPLRLASQHSPVDLRREQVNRHDWGRVDSPLETRPLLSTAPTRTTNERRHLSDLSHGLRSMGFSNQKGSRVLVLRRLMRKMQRGASVRLSVDEASMRGRCAVDFDGRQRVRVSRVGRSSSSASVVRSPRATRSIFARLSTTLWVCPTFSAWSVSLRRPAHPTKLD